MNRFLHFRKMFWRFSLIKQPWKRESRKMSLILGLHTNIPNAVEYVAIREYSDVKVRLENGVKRSKFFISEKCIWHPDPTCIRHCQITNFIWNLIVKCLEIICANVSHRIMLLFWISLTIRYLFLLFDMFILQPWVHPQLSHCNLEGVLLIKNTHWLINI